MAKDQTRKARVSNIIYGRAKDVHDAFTQPKELRKFWVVSASDDLFLGESVTWDMFTPGPALETTPTRLDPNFLSWKWSDGTDVAVEIDDENGAALVVTVTMSGFSGDAEEQIERALSATEQLATMLCDLKLLIEEGRTYCLMGSKARLMQDQEQDARYMAAS